MEGWIDRGRKEEGIDGLMDRWIDGWIEGRSKRAREALMDEVGS